MVDKAAGQPSETGAADWSWRSEAYAWWVVVVFAFALMLSLVDRMILGLMIEPIKRDLGLTDTEVGLVHGVAFTILYVVFGLVLGRVADVRSRRWLSGICVIFWSVATGLCGLATNFVQMFAARMAVGVGEAGLTPAAVSAISDYFPKNRRALPLTVLTLGSSLGLGVALLVGGAVLSFTGSTGTVNVPLIGPIYAWQTVFLYLGLFGVIFGLIFVTVKEPPRHEVIAASDATVTKLFAFIWERRSFLIAHFVATGLGALAAVGYHTWGPTFFVRSYGWDIPTAGFVYGTILLVDGVLGVAAAGWITQRLMLKGRDDAPVLVAKTSLILAIVPYALAPLMPTVPLVIGLLAIGGFFQGIVAKLGPMILQTVCPNNLRGQVTAVYLLVVSIMAYALGPLAIALVTDFIIGDEAKLYLSLSITAGLFLPLAAASMWFAHRNYRRFLIPA